MLLLAGANGKPKISCGAISACMSRPPRSLIGCAFDIAWIKGRVANIFVVARQFLES